MLYLSFVCPAWFTKGKYLLSQNPSRAEGWTIKIEQSKPNVHICSLPRSCRCPYNYLRETSSPANKTSRDKLLMATRRGKKIIQPYKLCLKPNPPPWMPSDIDELCSCLSYPRPGVRARAQAPREVSCQPFPGWRSLSRLFLSGGEERHLGPGFKGQVNSEG